MMTKLRPCRCGAPVKMVQLDSGHWIAACDECGAEGPLHWSCTLAGSSWNAQRLNEEATA